MHDDAKIHATSARFYNVLENWQAMKTAFRRNIFIRTDDLLILFYISICYDKIFILRENYSNDNVRFSAIVKICHYSTYEKVAGKSYSLEISFTVCQKYSIMMLD